MKEDVDQVYSTQQVCNKFGFSRATLDRMIKAEVFPPPLKVSGKRKNGWLGGTLRQYQGRLVENAEVVA